MFSVKAFRIHQTFLNSSFHSAFRYSFLFPALLRNLRVQSIYAWHEEVKTMAKQEEVIAEEGRFGLLLLFLLVIQVDDERNAWENDK